MVIMDLWGMAFHAVVVITPFLAILFIWTSAYCDGDPRPRPEIRGHGRGGDSIYPIFGDRDGVGTASS